MSGPADPMALLPEDAFVALRSELHEINGQIGVVLGNLAVLAEQCRELPDPGPLDDAMHACARAASMVQAIQRRLQR